VCIRSAFPSPLWLNFRRARFCHLRSKNSPSVILVHHLKPRDAAARVCERSATEPLPQSARHLSEVLDEYTNYHRIDGLIHKVDDDLLSAIRVGLMDLRYAKPLGGPGSFQRERSREPTIARGTDFDLFTGKVL
jgi:hypothetical protein